MKKFISLFFAVVFVATAVAQDAPHSVGPAPYFDRVVPQDPVPFQIGTRAFTQISTTPTFQFGKSFMESCTITNIGTPFLITFPGGLMYRNGIVYTWNQSSPFQLWSIDTVTGVHTLVFNMTGVPQANFTGMYWDGTNVYGVSTSITASQIFTVNMTTGVCTPIGTASTACAGAIFLAGRLGANNGAFTVDIVLDNLYKWNKTTGVATLVGPIGGNANFGQDASFDNADGKLYWMSYTTGPQLRTIDTATGVAGTVLCSYLAQATGIACVPPAGPPPPLGWCEGFNTTTFPPTGWTLTGSAALWAYNAVSGFGNGTGSAKADFYNVASGSQQLNTLTFPATTSATDSLIFQNAYCTFSTENDQLQILTSTNGGTNWTSLVTLNGGVSGELVTAPPQTSPFTPSANQWKYQRRALPVGTNRIQFNAITAFGNNLYIDSICVKIQPVGISNNGGVVKNFSLSQNYPNPFNPSTQINFSLPKASDVKLVVFDLLGREVATLVNEFKQAGNHNVEFNASSLASGVYFYKIVAGEFTATKKMLLVK